jgi:DHA2 family multidrug resistance protein
VRQWRDKLTWEAHLSAGELRRHGARIAALNHEVTRPAAMIAYNDDFALMLIVILASLPLWLLVRGPRRQPLPAASDD